MFRVPRRSRIEEDGLTVSVYDESLDVYVVQNGDTLWELARRFDTTINELCKLNKISKFLICSIEIWKK